LKLSVKYTKIFHSMAFKNLPKLGCLVWKYTIWQPCFGHRKNDHRKRERDSHCKILQEKSGRWSVEGISTTFLKL
jgi:hypothetical protein